MVSSSVCCNNMLETAGVQKVTLLWQIARKHPCLVMYSVDHCAPEGCPRDFCSTGCTAAARAAPLQETSADLSLAACRCLLGSADKRLVLLLLGLQLLIYIANPQRQAATVQLRDVSYARCFNVIGFYR